MAATILVTGATGNVGAHLLDALAADDSVRPRALVRGSEAAAALTERGIDTVIADLGDPSSLAAAVNGVDVVWMASVLGPRSPEHSMNLLWAARQANVRTAVRLSAIGAAQDAPTRNGRLHALSDNELVVSGLSWTILRPSYYMQNLFAFAPTIANHGAFYANMGDARIGMVDARDVATTAAAILRAPSDHAGAVYDLTGPASIAFDDVATALAKATSTPVKYVAVPDVAARQGLLDAGVPSWDTGAIVEYGAAYATGWGDFTTDHVARCTGNQPRTIDQFAHDNGAAFTRH